MCEVVRHAANNCRELPRLKPLVHEMFPNSKIPKVQVILLRPTKNSKCCTQITLVPCAIIMVIIPIVSLVSTNFVISFKLFASTRPLVVDNLLLYLWILVPLVQQNRGTLVPQS